MKIMHKRFKKLKRRSRRLRNRFGLYELLRTLLGKMGLETPFERKFKDYLISNIYLFDSIDKKEVFLSLRRFFVTFCSNELTLMKAEVF